MWKWLPYRGRIRRKLRSLRHKVAPPSDPWRCAPTAVDEKRGGVNWPTGPGDSGNTRAYTPREEEE